LSEDEVNLDQSDDGEAPEEKPSPQKPVFNLKRFFYMFLAIMTLMVFIDSDLRESLGEMIGGPLFALMGFDGRYPVLTLMLVGSFMIAFSTIVRDLMVDYVEMKKLQEKTSAFNKELMEARRANQTSKVKKMEKLQPQVSEMQMKTMKPQFKSMIVTMLVIFAIFTAMWSFVEDLPNQVISTPWAYNANLTTEVLPGPFPCQIWLLLYMLVSVPIGQVLRMTLQMFTYRKRIQEAEE